MRKEMLKHVFLTVEQWEGFWGKLAKQCSIQDKF
jgi:hypothetical protein